MGRPEWWSWWEYYIDPAFGYMVASLASVSLLFLIFSSTGNYIIPIVVSIILGIVWTIYAFVLWSN